MKPSQVLNTGQKIQATTLNPISHSKIEDIKERRDVLSEIVEYKAKRRHVDTKDTTSIKKIVSNRNMSNSNTGCTKNSTNNSKNCMFNTKNNTVSTDSISNKKSIPPSDNTGKNKNSTIKLQSILLDSPASSTSNNRVTFDFSPKIKEIPFIKKKIEVKDKSIILNKSMMKLAKSKARKYTAMIPSIDAVILKYKTREDLESDLKALNTNHKQDTVKDQRSSIYIENKLIVCNLGYKESEDSVKKFFEEFGSVEKVVLEKNKKGFCTGKGVVTFSSPLKFKDKLHELRMNGRLLRIEKIKKEYVNKTRIFVSHIRKSIKISEMRQILKEHEFVPKSIKIDLNDGRNLGYGFIEFGKEEEAQRFVREFGNMKKEMGEGSYVELSKEKKHQ